MEIIKAKKPKLIRWLRSDELILQHVQSKDLITKDEYTKVKSIQNPGQKITEILDLMMGKSDEICRAFLEMLKDDDVNESNPELRTWIATVASSSSSSTSSTSSSVPEDRNGVDNAEPQRKRFRSQTDECVDEPDNRLNNSQNLKTLSTMAKLEEWVSDPKISQKLIDDLHKKLGQGEMERLEDYLKDKKLKKSLCLTAKEINKIRSKKELKFFQREEKTKFPSSMLELFFEKDKDQVATANVSMLEDNYDEEDSTQMNIEESGSSGYGSLSQTNDQFQLVTSLHTISHPRDTDVPCSDKKTSDSESKNTDLDCVSPAEELGSRSLLTHDPTVIQKKDKLLPTEDLQQVQFENTPQTSDVPKSEKNVHDGDQNKHYVTPLPAVVDEPMQNEGLQGLQCKERNNLDVPILPDDYDGDQNKRHCTSLPAVADDLMQNKGLLDLKSKERSGSDVSKHLDILDGDPNGCYGTSVPAVAGDPMQNQGLQNPNIKESCAVTVAVKDQGKVHPLDHAEHSSVVELCSKDIIGQALNQGTPLNKSKKGNDNRKKVLMKNKMKKMTARYSVLRNWAIKQCSGSERKIEEVFDCILISDVVEHSEYTFLKAENVMKYINPTAGVNKMIYLTDEKLSINTQTLLQYHMYVCDIPSTIFLGLEERIISIDPSFSIDPYLRCISEVFVPALAVYKNIQRNTRLYSLI